MTDVVSPKRVRQAVLAALMLSAAEGVAQEGQPGTPTVADSSHLPSVGSQSSASPPEAEPNDASSTTTTERASALFWQANDHYSAARYAEAIELYEGAYALSGEAALLFNIAQCNRLLRRCEAAQQSYARYIEVEQDPPSQALEWVKELEAECSPPASTPSTAADAAPAGASDVAAPSEPGAKPQAASRHWDYAQPGQDDRSGWSTQRIAGWSLLGGAVAAAGLATWFGHQVGRTERDSEENAQRLRDNGETWDEAGAALEAEGRREQTLSIGFGVVAAISGLVGGGLLLLDEPARTTSSTAGATAVRPTKSRAATDVSLRVAETRSELIWGGTF